MSVNRPHNGLTTLKQNLPVLYNFQEEHHETDSKGTFSIVVASQPGLPPMLQGLGSLHMNVGIHPMNKP
jgi:hypothetical protein